MTTLTSAGSGSRALIRAVSESHLHAFTTAEGARYSDPFYGLDDCGDEDDARLSKTLPRPGAAMTYVYDFGDWWEHRIALEKVLDPDPDPALAYPTCLAGRGDAPVEDRTPEDPAESIPFDRADINRRLAAVHTPAVER